MVDERKPSIEKDKDVSQLFHSVFCFSVAYLMLIAPGEMKRSRRRIRKTNLKCAPYYKSAG